MLLRRPLLTLLLLFLALSAHAGDSLEEATKAIQSGDFSTAIRILKPWVDKGNAQAQFQLAMLHYNGKGTKENEKTAVDLLTRSAQQGNVEAMLQLGNAFTFGTETAKLVADADTEAAQWYFKAASAGNADAQYTLGLLFMAGKGVQKNEEEASRWMEKAAKQGHADAKNYVVSKK